MNRVSLLDVTQITKQAIYSSPGKLSSQPGRQMCKSHFKKKEKNYTPLCCDVTFHGPGFGHFAINPNIELKHSYPRISRC